MGRWRFIVPVAVIFALVALLGVGLLHNPHYIPSALIGDQAPEFQLPRLHQPEQLFTTRQLQGQVSVVNVWASWCVSCRVEQRLVDRLAKLTGVAVFGIDYKDQRVDAARWLRRFGDPFTAIGFDANGRTSIDWGVAGVPETFVLDHNGVIRYKQVGPIDREVLQNKLIPLIRKLQQEATS